MVDVIGFWVSVTLLSVAPVLFAMHWLTRLILSAAKKNSPELPKDLWPKGASYSWSGHWEIHLYPMWAHKLNRLFGGGLEWQYKMMCFIVCTPFTTLLLVLVCGGVVHCDTKVPYGLVEGVAYTAGNLSTFIGVVSIALAILSGAYLSVTKGTRLIGMIQIQEMREKKKNENC
ncbi:MAG: hypothetical protein ACRDC4_15025 [Plesiomonas sp.]